MPFKPKKYRKEGPERIIQDKVIKKLISLQWDILETFGSIYSSGWPDLYVFHHLYGSRWVEIKNPLAYSFTPAQLEVFRRFSAKGVGVWILVDDNDSEIRKLFLKPNWFEYL